MLQTASDAHNQRFLLSFQLSIDPDIIRHREG